MLFEPLTEAGGELGRVTLAVKHHIHGNGELDAVTVAQLQSSSDLAYTRPSY